MPIAADGECLSRRPLACVNPVAGEPRLEVHVGGVGGNREDIQFLDAGIGGRSPPRVPNTGRDGLASELAELLDDDRVDWRRGSGERKDED
jgi:hypothetical protein